MFSFTLFSLQVFESSISSVIDFDFFTGDIVKLTFCFAILLCLTNPLTEKILAILNLPLHFIPMHDDDPQAVLHQRRSSLHLPRRIIFFPFSGRLRRLSFLPWSNVEQPPSISLTSRICKLHNSWLASYTTQWEVCWAHNLIVIVCLSAIVAIKGS